MLIDSLTRNVEDIARHAHATGKVPAPELYDLRHDPTQKYNVHAENTDSAVKLHTDHVHLLEWLRMPEEYLCHRRQLRSGHILGGLFDREQE